jgi:hypothetical protein
VDTSLLRAFYLSHLSKPASDRPAYRAILRHKPGRILELGVGTGRRALRMIELARQQIRGERLTYIGIDVFEARALADGPGMSLRMAYRLLGRSGARVQLLPGDPFEALAQSANALGKVDLVVISSRVHPQRLGLAWFYIPRLLHDGSLVLRESPGSGQRRAMFEPVGRDEIAARAEAAAPRRRAA